MIVPILGCSLPSIGGIKTIMSNEKTKLGENKVISLEDAKKASRQQEHPFSNGFYHWVMFKALELHIGK